MKNPYLKMILMICGSISLILGILGIFLPLLPTTPFLLLAAACFGRSSQKLHDMLINHKVLGKYLANYYAGNGIPLRVKISAIIFLWLSIGYSALFLVPNLLIKGILILIAMGVTLHIYKIKTIRK